MTTQRFTIGQIHHMTTMCCLQSSIPIQLTNLILLGKYLFKPNFEHFIKEIKQYGTIRHNKEQNKQERPMTLFVTLNCCNLTLALIVSLYIHMNVICFVLVVSCICLYKPLYHFCIKTNTPHNLFFLEL